MSVVTSFATKLIFFILTQFRQIAKKPYFCIPVPPTKSSYKSFRYLPIKFAPLDLIGFLNNNIFTLKYVKLLYHSKIYLIPKYTWM